MNVQRVEFIVVKPAVSCEPIERFESIAVNSAEWRKFVQRIESTVNCAVRCEFVKMVEYTAFFDFRCKL